MVEPENGNHLCHTIKCDCCGKETLAQVKGGKLVIIDRRHGRKHVAVMTLTEILQLMSGMETRELVVATD